ncbi:cytochrome P450 76AD1-like [Amaranthus tricolor]|uniref:cytochrome P450 76AD1-like n=1 Tax=Amaranthus tricolor TaxID=29722 RepID=UPI002582D322|nr:cytochrome P450 76AD1-like [Amaranthus tricolor]
MEYYTITLLILLLTIVFFSKILPTKHKFPPGPKPWPIIGNIHQLGNKPHCSVAELSKIYGPIISLKLGSILTIVISSPKVAQEMFLKHDLTCSGRNILDSITSVHHHEYSIVFLPVCPRWRKFKKIATIQLFTNQRVDASHVIRQNKVNELIKHVRKCSETGAPVDIGKAVFTTTLNLLSNTFFSMDLASYASSSTQEFKDLVWHLLEEGARPNVSDFFPLIKKLDLQGVKKRATNYVHKMLRIFEEIIDGRLKDSKNGNYGDDVLSTLLKLVDEKELSLDEVKHFLFDLFVAGTDTSASTLEWAMTELLRNPEHIAKAQLELDQVFGKNGFIRESEFSKLPYIHAIVKETYRLHPATPFLVPRKTEKDVDLCGYFVPKDKQIWVNIWAIGRNPSIWPNPLSFSPERFLEREINVNGRDFELIPFGAGRRICPGMPLAYRMVHLMLASLLHSFNWKFGDGISLEDKDMLEEKFGITLQKAQSLQSIPFPR